MNLLEVIDAFESGLMKVCLAMLAAVVVGCAGAALYRAALRSAVARWRLLPWLEWAPLACLCVVCIVLGGEKTRRLPQAGGGPITAEEIAQGYRLEGVVTNDATSYVLPTNGVTYMPWSLRGGRETRFALDLGGFSFPFGTGVVRRVDVLSGGMVESLPRPSLAAICAAREWASLIPGESRFWWADADGGAAKLLTWEDVCAGRDRTEVYSAQIELRGNGDFTTRSNNVERVYRRVPYFDWDDDGLENSVDPEPLVAGPDAHGTNAEWYNTVCSNVLAAVATSCDPPVELTWLGGVNSNAYYFVDVVAERGPAPIWFAGDRESRLGDPVVVARAGETNRVPLLVGIDYAVTSDTPFSVSFPVDYMYPEVETNEPCVARIHWPLEFTVTPGTDNDYTVSAGPYDPGCEFNWGTAGSGGGLRSLPTRSSSCGYSTNGGRIGFSCGGNGDCGCHGCSVSGWATLELASFDLPSVWCGCWYDNPGGPGTSTNSPSGPPGLPAISISLDDNVVLYEAAYTNAPGESVARRSTQVELTLEYDNPTESSLPVTLSVRSGQDQIQLRDPSSGTTVSGWEYTCPPMTAGSRSFLIEGVQRSGGQDDVELRGTIGARNDTAHLTVVEFMLTPEEGTGSDLLHRHQFGACEQVWCEAYPTGMGVTWQSYGNGSMEPAGDHYKHRVPFAAQNYVLTAEVSGTTFPLTVQSLFPTDIIAIDKADHPVVVITNSIPAGEAGCVGMSLPLYCSPTNVSFINIELREFETPASIFTQYFATTNWIGLRDHQRSAISSDWFNPDSKGYFADDVAYIGYCAQPWLGGGTVEWSIPNACRPENLPVADTNMFLTTEQVFSLTADGTARVMKFGYMVERMTNEMINLWRPYGD